MTNRELVSAELKASKSWDELKSIFSNTKELNKSEELHVELEEPTSYLLELKHETFPVTIEAGGYAKITFDKLSSKRIVESGNSIVLRFDRGRSIMISKEDIGYRDMGFKATVNEITYVGGLETIENSINQLTFVDRILKMSREKCLQNFTQLLQQKNIQSKILEESNISEKGPKYKRLMKSLFSIESAPAVAMMMLEFLAHSKEA